MSTPTLSRFENGEKDIQLSSILNILGVVGMLDQRRLDFPNPSEKYIANRMVVRFIGQDGDKKIVCEISQEALDDHFHSDEQNPLKTFKENQTAIEHEARRKYIDGQMNAEGFVLITSED